MDLVGAALIVIAVVVSLSTPFVAAQNNPAPSGKHVVTNQFTQFLLFGNFGVLR